MKIRRDLVKDGDSIKQYIYIDLEESYEFGLDFFKKDDKNSFIYKLKEYVKSIINNVSNDSAILIINGIMVGTLSLSAFLGAYNKKMSEDTSRAIINDSYSKEEISDLSITDNFFIKAGSELKQADEIIEEDLMKEEEEISTLDVAESTGVDVNDYSEKIASNIQNLSKENEAHEKVINNNPQNNISNNLNEDVQKNEEVKSNENTIVEELVKEEITSAELTHVEEVVPQGIIIKLNIGGNIVDIELEEYIVRRSRC